MQFTLLSKLRHKWDKLRSNSINEEEAAVNVGDLKLVACSASTFSRVLIKLVTLTINSLSREKLHVLQGRSLNHRHKNTVYLCKTDA